MYGYVYPVYYNNSGYNDGYGNGASWLWIIVIIFILFFLFGGFGGFSGSGSRSNCYN